MAKTIAELSSLLGFLSQTLENTQKDSKELASGIQRLVDALNTARVEAVEQRSVAEHLRRELDQERALGRERDRLLTEVRQENALLRQRLDDHLKRVETWSGRLWALVSVLIGAVLSLASGLIVTLAKK